MSTRVPMISGSNIQVSRRVTREIVGEAIFERALEVLTPEERSLYLECTILSWIPVDVIERMMDAAARAAGRRPEDLVVEVARRGQEENLHTIYRVLMRITTDAGLIGRTQTFYSKVYDTGTLSSEFPAPGSAIVTLSGWPEIPWLQIVGLGAGVETTLRCAGRKEPRVQGRRAPDGAVYTCAWLK